jgi:uncharacterized membrane protein YcaP (DUF421 family)
MDSVLRAASIYMILLLIFRIAGRRTLSQITTFDLVLTLIISEAIQQAMIATDTSVTNAVLLVVTLVAIDVALSLVKQRWTRIEHVIEGAPLLLMADGRSDRVAMRKERVDDDDVLGAARKHLGLERLQQVKHAVIEPSGDITVVPWPREREGGARDSDR